jgi:hypothetical protein
MKNKEIMMMGWVGVVLLLSACEKDISGKLGYRVAVNFSTGAAGYDAVDEAMRSFSIQEPEPETVVVPMGNDLYLYATLAPDRAGELCSDELRAEVGLKTNQKIRFAAFMPDGTQEGATANYTYNGSNLVPNSGAPLTVEPDGTIYRFAAYSYYGDPETAPDETDIIPNKDLVWNAVNQSVTTTASTQTVNINMKHKFSRVRVKVDAHTIATAIPTISNVQIVGGKKVDLTDIRQGTVEATGTEAAQSVDFSGTSNVLLSDYYVYYPSVTGVKIGSIKLTIGSEDKTFSSLTAHFNKTLVEGKSYTLVLDIKELIWAKSNIYWDGDELMFSESGNSDYQGVFFKWGSLVGISPVGGDADALTLYIPPVSGGNWETCSASDSPWGNYNNIPRITSVNGSTDWTFPYLYTLGSSGYDSYTGDICAYLTNRIWRMPTVSEYNSFRPLTPNPNTFTDGVDPNDPTGRGLMGSAGITCNNSLGGIFFPASGYRTDSYSMVGSMGHYWSGSLMGAMGNNIMGCRVRFYSGVITDDYLNGTYLASVRCVKN